LCEEMIRLRAACSFRLRAACSFNVVENMMKELQSEECERCGYI
jgi:hypothetical protein